MATRRSLPDSAESRAKMEDAAVDVEEVAAEEAAEEEVAAEVAEVEDAEEDAKATRLRLCTLPICGRLMFQLLAYSQQFQPRPALISARPRHPQASFEIARRRQHFCACMLEDQLMVTKI